MGTLSWPVLDQSDDLLGKIEWTGVFYDGYRATQGNYKNLFNALYDDSGAIELFENRVPYYKDRGACKFFAVAQKGDREILVVRDKVYVYLVDRELLGDVTLSKIDPVRLQEACRIQAAQKMTLDEYRLYKGPLLPATLFARQPDPLCRKKVEEAAIAKTADHYEKRGFRIDSFEKDNVGWDLEAALGNQLLKLEVKGLSGSAICVELTPNEYEKMLANLDSYRVCVVTDALTAPALFIFAYSRESQHWENEFPGGRGRLFIEEAIAARCRAE